MVAAAFFFPCPACTEHITVSSREMGKEVTCPKCKQVIRVPVPRPIDASVSPLNRISRLLPVVFFFICSAFAISQDAQLQQQVASKDPVARVAAAIELRKSAKTDKVSARLLCSLSIDDDASVRDAAIASIEECRPDLYKPIREITISMTRKFPARKTAQDSVAGLARIGASAGPASCVVLWCFEKDIVSLDKDRLASVIKKGKEPPQSLPISISPYDQAFVSLKDEDGAVLARLIQIHDTSDTSSPMLRAKCALAAASITFNDKERSAKVAASLRSMNKDGLFNSIKLVYLDAVIKIGPGAKELNEVVKAMRQSPSKDIRERADKAFAAINK